MGDRIVRHIFVGVDPCGWRTGRLAGPAVGVFDWRCSVRGSIGWVRFGAQHSGINHCAIGAGNWSGAAGTRQFDVKH